MKEAEVKYLKMLSIQYPNIAATATEIINRKAIMSLPKGTEHFISDLHGEYEQFIHIMRNGSGAVYRKIEEEFDNSLSAKEKRQLAMLIYHPELKLQQIKKQFSEREELEDWYQVTILRLIRVCRHAASKYSRSKVRKALPKDFSYIMDELLSGRMELPDQAAYYKQILTSVIETERAEALIVDFCAMIRRFVIDHLHVIGDIYDRGPYPHLIMDELMKHHSVDIQWGNHDIIWMGAAAGSEACMANMLRISAKYGNLPILEDSYGINLLPLAKLAVDVYSDDPCEAFHLTVDEADYDQENRIIDERMHKAIAIIQFKLEGQLIKRHPEFNMDDRLLLDKIDFEKGTVLYQGTEYPMKDMHLPTVDPKDPYKLTKLEEEVVARLKASFEGSIRLQEHIRFLYTKGSLYRVYNGNLLFHGCVPLKEDGTFNDVEIYGQKYRGRALYDILEYYARKAYYSTNPENRRKGQDILWFIWNHRESPVFGKRRMTTFERYFIADKKTHEEKKNPYYRLYENEEVIDRILKEFGLDPKEGHIINGHVPVKAKKGESPAKCGGKVLVIDGGFSKAYQGTTGIAGYTLIYNSHGLFLTAHPLFLSLEDTVLKEEDVESKIAWRQDLPVRRTVGETDTGSELQESIQELEELLRAYRDGVIPEKE